ncbi:hypothetical protein D1007_03035 [Hordeum vulgare]|nr:hypothetical protein D1007_03035 [Hordeum vulgare]
MSVARLHHGAGAGRGGVVVRDVGAVVQRRGGWRRGPGEEAATGQLLTATRRGGVAGGRIRLEEDRRRPVGVGAVGAGAGGLGRRRGRPVGMRSTGTEMENKTSQPTEDDPQSKSATEVVAEVLAKHTKKPRFLQHVEIHDIHARSSASNCEGELAAENRNLELQEHVDTLTKLLKESEEARIRQAEDNMKRNEENRKKQAEMDKKLDFLLSHMQPRSAQE